MGKSELSMSKNTEHQKRLSMNDKLVLKFVDKKKRDRNWIRELMLYAFLKNKICSIPSHDGVDYILRKLAKSGFIKTEKWNKVHKRVYWR